MSSIVTYVLLAAGAALTAGGILVWRRGFKFRELTVDPKLVLAVSSTGIVLALLGSLLFVETPPPGHKKPPAKAVWVAAAGKVPNLELTPEVIVKTTQEIASADPENLEMLRAVVNSRTNLAVYNAVFSPVSPLGNNVVQDRQITKVDFYIGQPSNDNAIPAASSSVNPKVTGSSSVQHLTITLFCSFCDDPRIQKGAMDYSPLQQNKSDAAFSIVPRRPSGKAVETNLVFQVTGNGILYDNVVVPVAVAVQGEVTDAAKTSSAPNAGIGNAQPPPGSRTVDLTITTKITDKKVVVLLDASNPELAQVYGGKEKKQNGLPRELQTGISEGALADTLREDYVSLAAAINQNRDLVKTLHVDPKVLTLPVATKLPAQLGQILLNVMFKAGAILYRKLFVNDAEPDLATLMGATEKFVRKDGKPLLIRIETGGISIPWTLLHPPGPMDKTKFWGFRYDMVIDPLGRPQPGYYPGILQYQAGPLVFGKYKAALGRDQDVSDAADKEAQFLSATLGFKGLLKVESADAFKKALEDNEVAVRMVVVFLHARNDIAVQPGSGGAAAQPFVEGPELLFGADDPITIGSLEDLYLALKPEQTQVFGGRPLVFLNACQTGTGGFLSIGNRNFPGTFLDMGARGVIATEAPVWIPFADAFAQSLVKDLTGKTPVSLSLLRERVQFLKDGNNPLGLLYEYYGGVDSALVLN